MLFERHTGYNVMEHIHVFRLSRAAIALRSTDRSILEIALDHQYAYPENFARVQGLLWARAQRVPHQVRGCRAVLEGAVRQDDPQPVQAQLSCSAAGRY
ncbi:MAG: helix-turn-helix domain-containing protein [Chloroflexi bacterium]|nr:helix-turn-helix domain-containing protein [Chloroflexota bacterium]